MVLTNVKMLLIAPIVVYGGMELAFAFGSFTEVGVYSKKSLHSLYRYVCTMVHMIKFCGVCILRNGDKTTEGHTVA